jgi:hypothetical protein
MRSEWLPRDFADVAVALRDASARVHLIIADRGYPGARTGHGPDQDPRGGDPAPRPRPDSSTSTHRTQRSCCGARPPSPGPIATGFGCTPQHPCPRSRGAQGGSSRYGSRHGRTRRGVAGYVACSPWRVVRAPSHEANLRSLGVPLVLDGAQELHAEARGRRWRSWPGPGRRSKFCRQCLQNYSGGDARRGGGWPPDAEHRQDRGDGSPGRTSRLPLSGSLAVQPRRHARGGFFRRSSRLAPGIAS